MKTTPKQTAIIQMFGLFVPLFLAFYVLYPIENHLWVHAITYAFFAGVLGIVWYEKWSLRDLGMRIDNFRKTLLPYVVFTLLGVLIIFGFATFLNRTTASNWWTYSHFQYGFLITSVLQEFMFRSFLIPKLKSIFHSPLAVIAVNGLLFALIHLAFPDPFLLFPLGLISGVAFAAMYYYYPNFILIALAHSILNFFTMLHCFFSISIVC